MTVQFYETRLCQNCGLRYPLTAGHPFGIRCPSCLGETEAVRRDPLTRELPEDGKALPEKYKLRVLLDNVRSAWNVGSIFRSSDGFGFEHVYLCGITPTPEHADVRKTALGAEGYLTWSTHQNGLSLVTELRKTGWQILALEKVKGSIPIQSAVERLKHIPSVMVLGNEVTGVDPDILTLADRAIHLPMQGQKRSFNVAVAFAAAAAIIHSKLASELEETGDRDA